MTKMSGKNARRERYSAAKRILVRDGGHLNVLSGFDQFCPALRWQVLKYPHIPATCRLALKKIASNLDRAFNTSCS